MNMDGYYLSTMPSTLKMDGYTGVSYKVRQNLDENDNVKNRTQMMSNDYTKGFVEAEGCLLLRRPKSEKYMGAFEVRQLRPNDLVLFVILNFMNTFNDSNIMLEPTKNLQKTSMNRGKTMKSTSTLGMYSKSVMLNRTLPMLLSTHTHTKMQVNMALWGLGMILMYLKNMKVNVNPECNELYNTMCNSINNYEESVNQKPETLHILKLILKND
ncbi:hypothetical protein DAMA08_021060 (mitochondrion) [Martiniozyma asiatica (nom. inval.)]|nr:hypothetical protein DAMA08_021060 [Martiniozyma asiatica]